MTYIGRLHATVAQWVDLRPIFEVCAGETGYKGGGRRREALWRQGAADEKMWETLEEISQEARIRDAGTETGDARVGG